MVIVLEAQQGEGGAVTGSLAWVPGWWGEHHTQVRERSGCGKVMGEWMICPWLSWEM